MNKWKKLRKQSLGEIPQEASSNLQAPETAPSRSTNKIKEKSWWWKGFEIE